MKHKITFTARFEFDDPDDPVYSALKNGIEVLPHLKISGRELALYSLRKVLQSDEASEDKVCEVVGARHDGGYPVIM